ncbi:MAG: RNA polymerase sigma factor [Rudaea sp.]|uniref:RNA polymerase sigma factor n=1 Tax=unclassified Rudaea TaxID=2627037 RepID=UPI0010FA24E8|nr:MULTISPECIES: RNA polymerase sigma factor [unclassified Rudaea]MBN8884502.1 RNA polymerase sigma factor [Rudaea sp.]
MTETLTRNLLLLTPVADVDRARRFERFLAEQREALIGFLRHRTANETDAQDAAQESMVRLMRYRERQPAEAWKPLLYRIAINVAHDQARRQHGRREEAHHSIGEAEQELPSDQPLHEQRVADQQELQAIRELILRLPARCREVYLMNRIEGMSYSEIARHCGISDKAVEKHIAKALAALRRGLGERGLRAFKET